jgi:hypothetical protein
MMASPGHVISRMCACRLANRIELTRVERHNDGPLFSCPNGLRMQMRETCPSIPSSRNGSTIVLISCLSSPMLTLPVYVRASNCLFFCILPPSSPKRCLDGWMHVAGWAPHQDWPRLAPSPPLLNRVCSPFALTS